MFSKKTYRSWLLTQIYLRLPVFSKCLKWVFQVPFRRFLKGRDSLEVKAIINFKFLWIIAATTGRFDEWVSVFLEKRPGDVSRGTLNMVVPLSDSTRAFYVYICQKDDNQFRYITYTRSITGTSQRYQDADTSQKLKWTYWANDR